MYKLVFSAVVTLTLFAEFIYCQEIDTYSFLMPNVWPYRDELYLCTPIRISPHKSYYIVGFEPNATMHTAHHMLLYGCSEPGTNDPVWSCGEMVHNDVGDTYNTASPCRDGSQVVYAWARDAPSLHLPEGVGFHVGQGTEIRYLVLQVHYMSKFPEDKTDNSGVFLKYTTTPMPREAGVILLGTGGTIPARSVVKMETACPMVEDKVIHPFAFRTHTHGLGKVVSGYVIRRLQDGDKWELLGKKNPQLPQMFYPIAQKTTISKGDVVAARCTMNNTLDHRVSIGATNKDEMCNFYLMYWVENDTPLQQKYCFTQGPPHYSWALDHLESIPDYEASSLEDSNK
nr:venom polypeptide precursor [Doratifera vulnerans]